MSIKIIYPIWLKKYIRKDGLSAFFSSLPMDANSLMPCAALKTESLNLFMNIWRILFSPSFYPTPNLSNMILNSSWLQFLPSHSYPYRCTSPLLSTYHQCESSGRWFREGHCVLRELLVRKKAYESIITIQCDGYDKEVIIRKYNTTERPLISPVWDPMLMTSSYCLLNCFFHRKIYFIFD